MLDNGGGTHYHCHMNENEAHDEIDPALLENWQESNNLNEWYD